MAGGTPSHLLSLGEAGLVGGLEQGLHSQGVTEQVGRACLSQTGLKHGSDLARFSLRLIAGAGPYLNRLKMAMATRRVARDKL